MKDPETGIKKNYWFAINEDRPLFFFAGLWNYPRDANNSVRFAKSTNSPSFIAAVSQAGLVS